jgi:membrane protease YdiL (CAAX protease family)
VSQVLFDLSMIAVPAALALPLRTRSRELLAVRRMSITPARAALWIFLGTLAASVAGVLYVAAFDVRGHTWITDEHADGADAIIFGLAAVTLVPVAEEIFWRGLVHRALRTRLALWPTVALSSTLFGLAHWVGGDDFSTVLPRVFYGVLLAMLLEQTGSLYPGMVAHAYVNLTVLDLFAPSLAAPAGLVVILALVAAIAVSARDPRRKKYQRVDNPARSEAALRATAAGEHANRVGRLGIW